MAFTYDITTDRGKVRFLVQDNDATTYVFQDAEIDYLITLAPGNLFIAAAMGCETKGRSQLILPEETRLGDGTVARRRAASEWLAMAAALRNDSMLGGLVTDTWNVSSPDEMLDSYRPEWRGINDIPIVE